MSKRLRNFERARSGRESRGRKIPNHRDAYILKVPMRKERAVRAGQEKRQPPRRIHSAKGFQGTNGRREKRTRKKPTRRDVQRLRHC